MELGFLRQLRGQTGTYEVARILKAYVDAQWLEEFDARLAAYRSSLTGGGIGTGTGTETTEVDSK